MPSDQQIRELLASVKTIAVVGLSDDRRRPSNGVSRFMQQAGFRVIPVNPNIESALGERAYPSLQAVPDPIDLIDVFRRPCYVADLVAPAIASGARAFWMQLGVRDDASAQALESAGLTVVSDRCLMLEFGRLLG